ncbi:ran-binding protein 3-like isoform X1 [Lingula anatina]|uniref:Ran-binding protein 3-like isoform X1 n=1 Tax=Lingula anatina TaxID=7574 RepID=A0A1S3K8Y9_LINAN|nr:ran-binding protein 3-like isoform X1 [Lingula anatina]|eukprot:XP_013418914.1 ran-binding protein 3-like isoform X1 [Lingula anatina]
MQLFIDLGRKNMADINTENKSPGKRHVFGQGMSERVAQGSENSQENLPSQGFLFGQGMSQRVTKAATETKDETTSEKKETVHHAAPSSSGSGSQLFSSQLPSSPETGTTRHPLSATCGSFASSGATSGFTSASAATSGVARPFGGFRPVTAPMTGSTVGQHGGSHSPYTASEAPYGSHMPRTFTGVPGGVLAPSKFAPNPFASRPAESGVSSTSAQSSDSESEERKERPIIAPAHLRVSPLVRRSNSSSNEANSSFAVRNILRPSTLSAQTAELGKGLKSDEESEPCSSSADGEKTKPLSLLSHQSEDGQKGSVFACVVTKPSSTETEGQKFVFGQKMDERVVNAPLSPAAEPSENTFEEKAKSEENTTPTKTLEESANEYQAKQAIKEYKEVEVVTGEEEESNVFHNYCKLFVFDKSTQAWVEKGRGHLRLNDSLPDENRKFHSRLVMRTTGSLRVVLNCKIWSGMSVDRASHKSVRITALEEDGLKVYLIMATPKDTEQLFRAIDWRVQQLKVAEETEAKTAETVASNSENGVGSHSHHSKRKVEDNETEATGGVEVPSKKSRQSSSPEDSDRPLDSQEESNCDSLLDVDSASNSSYSLQSTPGQ